jgi:hypothetical protein
MLTSLLAALALVLAPQGGDLTAAPHSDPPPSALAAPIVAHIGAGGARVTAHNVPLTFWWVKAVPLNAGSSAKWADVAEGTLVGAVKIDRDFRDVRGKIIKPGVYTLRYGIQPENGDHLGVSPYRDFVLLSPAALDKDAAPRGHDGSVEISKETIGGSHPAVWSLDPPETQDAPLSVHATDAGLKAVVFEVPASRDGGGAGAGRGARVVIGKI